MSERLLADGLRFPEGPAFDGAGNLWCVELQGGGLLRWKDGHRDPIPTAGKNPTNCAFDPRGVRGFIGTEAETGALLSHPLAHRGSPLFRGARA